MVVLWFFSGWWLGIRLRPEFTAEEYFPRSFWMALWGPAAFNLLLQIANFIGWPYESGFLSYLVGLLLWLFATALLFASLVIYRETE